MVVVRALALFVLIFLSLIGYFECSWLLLINTVERCDDVIYL